MPRIERKDIGWKTLISQFAMVALMSSASAAFATAPSIVVDSQSTVTTALNIPQAIAAGPNNIFYIANSGANSVVALSSGTVTTVSTGSITLKGPQAVAVDVSGDLFIGDSPSTGVGRVIKCPTPVGASTCSVLVRGGKLKDVFSLTVDKNPGTAQGTLYIGDDVSNAVYTLAPGATTLVNLGLTGITSGTGPNGFAPDALVLDTSGNLYVSDFDSTVYVVALPKKKATPLAVPGFTIYSATGLTFDPSGNLDILTVLNDFNLGVLQVPLTDTTSAFEIPVTGLLTPSALATDTSGNVYITDYNSNPSASANGSVVQLTYGNAVNLSAVAVGSVGPAVAFNYEFNARTDLRGFQAVSQGDGNGEIKGSGGSCGTGNYTTGNDGSAIGAAHPFVCTQNFAADPLFPGPRYDAIRLKGPSGTILFSNEVYATGLSPASVIYPLTDSVTYSNTTQFYPTALALSGSNKTMYVLDDSVSPGALFTTTGPAGKTLTKVTTGSNALNFPTGIAINGNGDLYISNASSGTAQTGPGYVSVVPASDPTASFILDQTTLGPGTGALLNFPVSIAFDSHGNLFIGDGGPQGNGPGYIVEVPADGSTPFKVNTGSITLYYPGTLAFDPVTGDLYVGDLGPISGPNAGVGQVVQIPVSGAAPQVIPIPNITQPATIVFDPSGQYYILDTSTNPATITAVPPGYPTNPTQTLAVMLQHPSLLTNAYVMAATQGTQNFVVGTVLPSGSPTTYSGTLVYLNGLTANVTFGGVPLGHTATAPATLLNIGNLPLTVTSVTQTSTGPGVITFAPTDTCAVLPLTLAPAATCSADGTFAPVATGRSTTTLTLVSNSYKTTSASKVTYSGTGTAPK